MEGMNLANALIILQIAALLGSGALNVYLFMRARSKEWLAGITAAIDKVDRARLADHREAMLAIGVREKFDHDLDRRLVAVEKHLDAMPTHADLVALRRVVSQVSERLSAVDERSETVLEAVRTLQRFLMERGQ